MATSDIRHGTIYHYDICLCVILAGISAAGDHLNETVADAVNATAAAEVVTPQPLVLHPPSALPSSESHVPITAATLSSNQSQGASFKRIAESSASSPCAPEYL